jgi:hypothetical protein
MHKNEFETWQLQWHQLWPQHVHYKLASFSMTQVLLQHTRYKLASFSMTHNGECVEPNKSRIVNLIFSTQKDSTSETYTIKTFYCHSGFRNVVS